MQEKYTFYPYPCQVTFSFKLFLLLFHFALGQKIKADLFFLKKSITFVCSRAKTVVSHFQILLQVYLVDFGVEF